MVLSILRASRQWLTALTLVFGYGCGGGGGSTPTEPLLPSSPAPPPAQVAVLRSASLQGANGHRTEGTAQVVRLGDQHSLELLENFRTDPQVLELRLCRDDRCRGEFLRVAPLARTQGSQSYSLPNDGSAYAYVVVWCIPFQVPIGVGELR